VLKEPVRKKLADVTRQYDELGEQLSLPEVIGDPRRLREMARARARLEPAVVNFKELLRVEADLAEGEALLAEEQDSGLAEELSHLRQRQAELVAMLEEELAPKDPDDERDCIVEIRAGTGGEEAALFAGDLLRMYMRYAERAGWKMELLSRSPGEVGGYKEAVVSMRGAGTYGRLKHERGAHRVQRVPVTESSGRIHTSAATVAVLPEVEDVEVHIDPADLEVETFRSSGPGGQHMQKNETAVRLTHKPTGLTVTCQDQRSQVQNRERAMRFLRARLYEIARAQQEAEIAAARRKQVGTGDRSEKIRTYNYPQNRVTDHRLGRSWHNLTGVLEGEMDAILDALAEQHRLAQMARPGADTP